MPCVGLLAPAGMLLVVILGVLPLMLPSSSAGSAPALVRPKTHRARHLRPVALSLAARSDPAAERVSTAETVGPGHAVSHSAPAAVVVSRRGPSPAGEMRVAASIPAPRAAGTRDSGRRLRLMWPSRGAVTSPFGWRIHPLFGTREFHTGLDIAGQSGAPVVAAYPGVVRFVGWKSGYGRLVVLDHGGGLETAYSHLSASTVRPGTRVLQGQEIGRVGSTGWSTGPHLLFEVFENGIPQDPTGYLN